MVNTSGKLIGINTMNLSLGGGSDGIGLAVPSNLVKNIIEQIIEYGQVVRGYVGLSAYDTSKGVMITKVLKNGPADLAGLKPRDIILGINDMKIKNIKQVVKIVASLEVNQKITVKHLRNDSILETIINVAQMPESHKTINR